jgi:hypothetical protein
MMNALNARVGRTTPGPFYGVLVPMDTMHEPAAPNLRLRLGARLRHGIGRVNTLWRRLRSA